MNERNPAIEAEAAQYYWYHCMRLGDYVTDGEYDMEPLLGHYGLPDDMHGMEVLDVGPASGFFSMLMEERGANVTAVELPSLVNWDWVGGPDVCAKTIRDAGGEEAANRKYVHGAFDLVRRYRNARVRMKYLSVYDIAPDTLGGTFDVVFCGSVMSHLRDPARALDCLARVTRGKLILATPVWRPRSRLTRLWCNRPFFVYLGSKAPDRTTWWLPTVEAMRLLLRDLGFAQVSVAGNFALRKRHRPQHTNHAVFHAGRS